MRARESGQGGMELDQNEDCLVTEGYFQVIVTECWKHFCIHGIGERQESSNPFSAIKKKPSYIFVQVHSGSVSPCKQLS